MNLVTSRPDASNPNEKHWSQHGILIIAINEHGEERITIKINSLPIGEFNGWFSVYPKEDDPNRSSTRNRHNSDEYDDSVPF